MKSNILRMVIASLFLILFNAVFFTIVPHTPSNWCTYGFITFAYLFLMATPLLAKGSNSGVLVGALWLQGMFYFITALVVGVVFFFINPENILWPLLIQGAVMAWFVGRQLMNVLANDRTTASLNKQRSESFARQMLIDKLQSRRRAVSDSAVVASIDKCLDALQNSPLESFPESLDSELALSNAVSALCGSIDTGDAESVLKSSQAVLAAIQDRNLVIRRIRMAR